MVLQENVVLVDQERRHSQLLGVGGRPLRIGVQHQDGPRGQLVQHLLVGQHLLLCSPSHHTLTLERCP